jgi:hypothetical protein
MTSGMAEHLSTTFIPAGQSLERHSRPTVTCSKPSGGLQCTELANRALFDIWGLQPVFGSSLDGASFAETVHADYPSVPLVANGTSGRPYVPGDIVSFTGNSQEPDGHVAVVIASTENGSGNGTATLMEENAASSGKEILTVSNWKLLPAAGAYVTPYDFDALASGGGGANGPSRLQTVGTGSSAGRTQVFAIGTNGGGNMYVDTESAAGSTSWSGWQDLGGEWPA